MDIEQYQKQASKNWKPGNDITTLVLGLVGETGEVVDIYKKARRDEKELDKKLLKEELGDVLWYIAGICSIEKIKMEDLLIENIKKLEKRYGK